MIPDCLTPFQQQLVLSLFPKGSEIGNADWMQVMRPCPIAVDVRVPGESDLQRVVLRRSRNRGGVEREALVLPELHQLGLPVPQILAGPAADAEINETISVLSFLPGEPLKDFAVYRKTKYLRAKELAIESLGLLHQMTSSIINSTIAGKLPRRTIWDTWLELKEHAGSWMMVPEYAETLRNAESACRTAALHTPLVFSNGDYQPNNYLTDGESITGILDFDAAGFIDPLFDVARYPVYGIEALTNTGVAYSFCTKYGFTSADLELRVIVFGLRALRTKASPERENDRRRQQFRDPLLALVLGLSNKVRNKQ
jgi:aminoglycoside phosphotransferase (APT) family kinase protein